MPHNMVIKMFNYFFRAFVLLKLLIIFQPLHDGDVSVIIRPFCASQTGCYSGLPEKPA